MHSHWGKEDSAVVGFYWGAVVCGEQGEGNLSPMFTCSPFQGAAATVLPKMLPAEAAGALATAGAAAEAAVGAAAGAGGRAT